MKNKPLLTVVMPTHNRSQYAKFAVTSVLSLRSLELQLVVHDTSETDELENFIAANVHDDRLKYIHYPQRLSMTENHNAAMDMAEGEYVCLIGDDDTILPEAIEAVAWAKANGIDALSPAVVANYAWPDFRSRFFGMGHASRAYVSKKFEAARKRNAKESLKSALQGAAQGTEGLPKVYHGFVRRSVMQEIKQRSGAYFHGSSPDVSGAVGVASMVSSFVEVTYALTLPGASGKSNTGRSAVNTHKGALAKDSQTAEYAAKGWSIEVPRFFSVETVWAHAAIETIRRLDAASLKDFDFIRLYATCWLRHKEYRNETLHAFRAEQWASLQDARSPRLALALAVAKLAVSTSLRLAKRALVPTAAGGRDYIPDLKTIQDAQTALIAYFAATSLTYQRYIADFKPPKQVPKQD